MATAKTKPTLEEVDEFLSEAILIPIPTRGEMKKYRVEAVGMKTGLQLQKQMAGVQRDMDAGIPFDQIELEGDDATTVEDYYRRLLSCYEEMLDDDLRHTAIQEAAAITMLWTMSGFNRAKEYYDAGGKAPAANRAARRTATQTPKAAANTTQKPASATTTKPKSQASNGSKS